MNKTIKHISRIRDEFDIVVCGVNGVLTDGQRIFPESIDVLVKLYQSGKKIALASNTGMRVQNLFWFLKRSGVPMNIFYAVITAGEIAHYHLKNQIKSGSTYFSLDKNKQCSVDGLAFEKVDSVVLADFILAETNKFGVETEQWNSVLEQALSLHLPFLCVGNDTSVLTKDGVKANVGSLAEQFAIMGGKIVPFGKPDLRIATYLTENIGDFDASRCLFIGDNMATDMRLGNNFGGKNLLLTNGVHQIKGDLIKQVDELSTSYGLSVDYCMEKLEW